MMQLHVLGAFFKPTFSKKVIHIPAGSVPKRRIETVFAPFPAF
jgi:hypothetical protein